MSQFNKYLEMVQEEKDYTYNEETFRERVDKILGLAALFGVTAFAPIISNLESNFYTNKAKNNLIAEFNKKTKSEKESYLQQLIKKNITNPSRAQNITNIIQEIGKTYSKSQGKEENTVAFEKLSEELVEIGIKPENSKEIIKKIKEDKFTPVNQQDEFIANSIELISLYL